MTADQYLDALLAALTRSSNDNVESRGHAAHGRKGNRNPVAVIRTEEGDLFEVIVRKRQRKLYSSAGSKRIPKESEITVYIDDDTV